ncbi:MAG: glycosyltransferase family 4 protein [Candidatus Falkowbacteria bacterium]
MKIALIGQKGIPSNSGGVETHVENLAIRLVQAGHEVIAYSRKGYTGSDLKEYKGVEIINIPSVKSKNLEAIVHTFLSCLDLIFKRKVDVVHFHSIGPSSLMFLIKLFKPRTPIVFTFHCQDYYHQKWGVFARLYLKFGEMVACHLADKTITVSKDLEAYAKAKYNARAKYIPNGVSLPEILEANSIKQWGLAKDNYIVAVSRLIRHKGLHYLIAAYQQIKTDKKLVIVGDSSYTDDYVEELKALAGDNKNIIFTGKQGGQTLAELFSNAYLFVQPSESEGLSIALLEAMSYKNACLVSDIPANREVVDVNGLSFKNTDIHDLKVSLEYLLLHEEIINKNKEDMYARVKTEYSWDDIVKNIINEYQLLTIKK